MSARRLAMLYFVMKERAEQPPSSTGAQLDRLEELAWHFDNGITPEFTASCWTNDSQIRVRSDGSDIWEAEKRVEDWMDRYANLCGLMRDVTPFEKQVLELLCVPIGSETYERTVRQSDLYYTNDRHGQPAKYTTGRDEEFIKPIVTDEGEQYEDWVMVRGTQSVYMPAIEAAQRLGVVVEMVRRAERYALKEIEGSRYYPTCLELFGMAPIVA